MTWFEKGETLDLTELQKRGILKKALKKENVNEGKEIDLTSSFSNQSQTTPTSSSSSNPFDLLSSLASSSATNKTLTSAEISSNDIQHLKVKLEDLEYKIDRFLERIEKIEGKLMQSDNLK